MQIRIGTHIIVLVAVFIAGAASGSAAAGYCIYKISDSKSGERIGKISEYFGKEQSEFEARYIDLNRQIDEGAMHIRDLERELQEYRRILKGIEDAGRSNDGSFQAIRERIKIIIPKIMRLEIQGILLHARRGCQGVEIILGITDCMILP